MRTTTQRETVSGVKDHRLHCPGVLARLQACHDDIRKRLDVLEAVGHDLLSSGRFTRRHLASMCDAFAFLDVVVPLHTADEEETLFPELCLRERRTSRPSRALEIVRAEHAGHGVLDLRLKIAVLRREAKAAGRLAVDLAREYRDHLCHEEQSLFPWAAEVLTDPELLAEMEQEMHERWRDCGMDAPGMR